MALALQNELPPGYQPLPPEDMDLCDAEAVNRLYKLERAAFERQDFHVQKQCQKFAMRILLDNDWFTDFDPSIVRDLRNRFFELEMSTDLKASQLPTEEKLDLDPSDPDPPKTGIHSASTQRSTGGKKASGGSIVKRLDIHRRVIEFLEQQSQETSLQRHGLRVLSSADKVVSEPPPVMDEFSRGTFEYQTFQDWLKERCDIGCLISGTARLLYNDYTAWCRRQEQPPVSIRNFGGFLGMPYFREASMKLTIPLKTVPVYFSRKRTKQGTIYAGLALKR